jgi:undecaprenyl-diphosphatase
MTEQKIDQCRLHRINLTMWVSVITLCLATLLSYFLLDERVFSWLSQHPNKWHKNNWLEAFKLLGKGWVLIWLLLIWVWATGKQRPALVAILALLLVFPMVYLPKFLVHRPRPREIIAAPTITEEAKNNNGLSQNLSFPSGDTAAVFAIAAALVPFIRRLWVLTFFTLSSIIGILRVAVLAHYPSDVCAGAAVGILAGWLAPQILSRWPLPAPSRLNWYRIIAAGGVILLPVLFGLIEGIDELLTFLKTYGVLVAGIYLVAKGGEWLKRHRKRDSCNH